MATLEGRHDSHLHHGGDGASGSSVGTASPDLFRVHCNIQLKTFFLHKNGFLLFLFYF